MGLPSGRLSRTSRSSNKKAACTDRRAAATTRPRNNMPPETTKPTMIIRMSPLFVALSISIWLQGCCPGQRTEPSYPNDVTGWKDFKEGTTKLRGSFVLKKAERTDNGKLEIRVLDLMPPECTGDAGNYAERARVRVEFRRVSDQRVLCSETF